MKIFKLNEYLTVKLEDGFTNIYVNDEYFEQCKFLLLEIPKEDLRKFDQIESIDEAANLLSREMENIGPEALDLSPETEFWGHCSNLQVWIENDYDTRLMHSNLAFPLLKHLTRAGDPKAKRVFKEEIAKRLLSGYPTVVNYLLEEGYLHEFTIEEKESLSEQLAEKILLIKDFEEFCNVYTSYHNSGFEFLSTIVKDRFSEYISNNDFLESNIVIPRRFLNSFDFREVEELFSLIKPQILKLMYNNLRFLNLKVFSDYGIKNARRALREEIIKVLLENNDDVIKYLIEEKYLKVLNRSDLEMFIDFPGCSDLILDYLKSKPNRIPRGVYVNGNFIKEKDGILNLEGYGIEDLNKVKGFNNLKNIVELNLAGNKIKSIDCIQNCINLNKLKLNDNLIPEDFINQLGGMDSNGYVKQSKSFIVYSRIKNHIGVIFNERNHLKVLDLPDLNIKSINSISSILNFQELTILDLSRNKISKIEGISHLKKLKRLNLSYNSISNIQGLDELTNLEELLLEHNHISEISGLRNLSKLRMLTLGHNNISHSLINELGGFKDYMFGRVQYPQKLVEYCINKSR